MKLSPIATLLVIVSCLFVAGCDSLDDATMNLREKFAARDEPRTKTFTGSPRVAYEAVKAAANAMGYTFTHGGPAQGEFEAVSGVQPGETSGSSRQVAMKVRLHATLDGSSTEVSVRFTEILEADSSSRMGMATETTMRDTPLYEVFFRQVQEALGVRPTAQPVK